MNDCSRPRSTTTTLLRKFSPPPPAPRVHQPTIPSKWHTVAEWARQCHCLCLGWFWAAFVVGWQFLGAYIKLRQLWRSWNGPIPPSCHVVGRLLFQMSSSSSKRRRTPFRFSGCVLHCDWHKRSRGRTIKIQKQLSIKSLQDLHVYHGEEKQEIILRWDTYPTALPCWLAHGAWMEGLNASPSFLV